MSRHGNSTIYETKREVMVAITPDGEPTEVIITRQDRPGDPDRTWVTFHGAWRGTVCFDPAGVEMLREMLDRTATR